MNNYKRFTYRIGLIGITNFLVALSGIVLMPVLTKNMSIEEYGIWAQVGVTISIVPAISLLGLPYTMVRFLPSANKRETVQEIFYSIFFLIFTTGTIISLLIYIFSNQISAILFDSNQTLVKIISLIVFIECMNSLFLNYFRAKQQIKKYSILLFLQTCLYVIFVSFLVLSGTGIIGAVIGLFLRGFTIFIISSFSIIFEIGFKRPKFENLKEYLAFGVPTVPGNLSSWVVNSSDRYVIGFFFGTAAVGYYSPGYSLGSMISMFFAPLSFMLPAVLSKNYDDNNMKEVKLIIEYSLKYFLAIAIPAAFGLSFLSKPLLMILTTPEIASQGYLITPFTAASALFLGVQAIMTQIIILEKKTKITGAIWILSAISNLGLNFIFIPHMGIIGAAITTLIAFTFCLITTSYYSFKYIKFDVNSRFLLKSVFASIIVCLIIGQLNPIELIDILTTITISIFVYFVILYLLGGFEEREVRFFKNILNL